MPARVSAVAEAKPTVERSRFFARLFPVASEADIELAVAQQRALHRKDRHHCWAARWRERSGGIVEASRDDGEVGQPGWVWLDFCAAAS